MSLCERHYGEGMLKLDAPHALSLPGWFQESIVKLVLEPKTQRGVGTSQKIQKQEFRIELQVVCEQFVEFYLKANANSRFCRGPQSQICKQKLFLLVSEVRSLKSYTRPLAELKIMKQKS